MPLSVVEAEIKARFFAEAIEACREIEDADMHADLLRAIADAQNGAGSASAAKETSRRAAAIKQPSQPDDPFTRIRFLIESGRFGEALTETRKTNHPDKLSLMFGIAQGQRDAKQTEDARKRSPSCRPSCVRSGTWRKRTGGFAASVASTTNWE